MSLLKINDVGEQQWTVQNPAVASFSEQQPAKLSLQENIIFPGPYWGTAAIFQRIPY